MTTNHHSIAKLGKTSSGERTRIWLEGARLPEAGFHVGRYFLKSWARGQLILTICTTKEYNNAPRDTRGKVSGVKGRAIIDMTGQAIAAFFHGSHVSVNYGDKRITISNNPDGE